jgi:hypothetical protein
VESSVSAVLDIPAARSTGPEPPGHGTPEARTVTADGDVVLLVPAASRAARIALRAGGGSGGDSGDVSGGVSGGDEIPAVLEITDVAPVAVPHRVRGRAWVAGWLTAVGPEERPSLARLIVERNPAGPPVADVAWLLLRLEVGEAYVDDLWGEEQVEPDDFAAASPDPLAAHEAELLQHLAAAHDDRMRTLCGLLDAAGPACAAAGARAVPLSVDRHGLRVRFCELAGHRAGACFDARFEFPEPVEDVAQLRRAMRVLFDAADAAAE